MIRIQFNLFHRGCKLRFSRMKEKVNKRGLNPVEELEEIEDKRMEEPEYDKKDDSDLEYSPKKKTRKERKSPKDKNV